jgi:isopropylmalate/homocitrate/citramalate synthase
MYNIQVSPYNDKSSYAVRKVNIVDCTLRDGEQQPGIVFTRKDKVKIAQYLDRLGVDEIEAGMPAVSRADFEAIEEIVSLKLKAKISALANSKAEDIKLVKKTGAWGLRISLPSSTLQRRFKLRKTDDEVLAMALNVAELGKESGLYVIFSPYDTTRCDLPFLVKLVTELHKRNLVDRIRIVDTVGSALPSAIRFLVRVMKDASGGLPIEIHCHNDFGMALASTTEGVLSGCEYVSCAMNGLGPHSGNVALEEVALLMELLYGISTGIDLRYICEVASLVEKLSGVKIHPNKAVIGPNAFATEAGLAVGGILKNVFTGHAYEPELVGQKLRIVIGKKSGLPSIRHVLDAYGISMPDEDARQVLQEVKTLAIRKKRTITDEELLEIANRYAARST